MDTFWIVYLAAHVLAAAVIIGFAMYRSVIVSINKPKARRKL